MNPVTERDPAKNPLAWLMPVALPDLVTLGRSPKFITYAPEHDHPSGLPATKFQLDNDLVKKHAHVRVLQATVDIMQDRRNGSAGATGAAIIEIYSALAVDGAKLFSPTEEQFEAMEQVEVSIPVSQYRQPYPALAVRIPLGCRARLAREVGLPIADTPFWVVVRHRRGLDPCDVVLIHLGSYKLGDTFYVFQENPLTPSVETALARDAGNDGSLDAHISTGLQRFGHRAARAAMNLAIMLTRVPTKLRGPDAPKNRDERRKREHGGEHSYQIIPDQTIIVRGSVPHEHGEGGTGGHVRPHWRKGHWRAHPGFGEARARGEQVPLVFVSPCAVRFDLNAEGAVPGSTAYRG